MGNPQGSQVLNAVSRLVAIQLERTLVIVDILQEDKTGTVERLLAEHLSGKGKLVEDRVLALDTKGRVYFVECPARGLVKIGFTKNITERMRTLRTSATDPIALLGHVRSTKLYERKLHARFAEHRRFGEWFTYGPELRKFVQKTCGGTNSVREEAS